MSITRDRAEAVERCRQIMNGLVKDGLLTPTAMQRAMDLLAPATPLLTMEQPLSNDQRETAL